MKRLAWKLVAKVADKLSISQSTLSEKIHFLPLRAITELKKEHSSIVPELDSSGPAN
jgi:hypothetical protein